MRIATDSQYLKKIIDRLQAGSASLPAGLHTIDVYHDQWCGIYRGTSCNCNPDVVFPTLPPKEAPGSDSEAPR